MSKDRSEMTVRIVPLGSHDAGDGRKDAVPERVAVIGELTKAGWAIAQMPIPERGAKNEGEGK